MLQKYRKVADIWVFPKIVISPNHPLKNRVFHYKPSILGYPYFWKNLDICLWMEVLRSIICYVD